MRERERIKNQNNLNKVINGINITESRHENLKNLLKEYFGVSWRQITSRSRAGNVVRARRHYFYVMRYIFLYTLEDIGLLTNKNHATVIHNLKVQDIYMELYPEEKEKYQSIKKVMLERISDKEIKERVGYLEEQKQAIQKKIDELLLKKKRINKLITNK
jgi:chromosomal replication initiation ATPase DnaA